MSTFTPIDLTQWPRTLYFNHFLDELRCTYSITFHIDVTSLWKTCKAKKIKFYAAELYLLTRVANQHEEFRTAFDENNQVGLFDEVHPSYTVFHPESETFSSLWTPYSADFSKFYAAYLADLQTFGNCLGLLGKPNPPSSAIPISSLPWADFSSFQLNIYNDGRFLLPIFTLGRVTSQGQQFKLPLCLQVHHAVCDGFHASRFAQEVEALAADCSLWM